ncbi:ankyrin repeat domain-containing protein 31-like isoform X6 [Siniperca chuatsi]|uniref:ankyrin repeat domain-containing protein 31-like isoform X6 n=1 Tax=Siniperca chuatsi TaxID=119488 RepID=UPI001CE0CB54|nr:ankyrin repeat domain-containing protein 31-like isoform X6 [Siniperca chuatsi]
MSCTGAKPAYSQEGDEHLQTSSSSRPTNQHHQPTEVRCLSSITADHSYAKYLRRNGTAKLRNVQEDMKPICSALRKTTPRTAQKDFLTDIKPDEVRWPKSVVTATGKTLSLHVVNRRNRFGESLLHKAVLQGDIQLLKDILKLGPDVSMTDNAGWTPLHEAALCGHYEACLDLIKAGALVNAAAHDGITPLHDAIRNGHETIAELLLKHGANPMLKDKSGENAFGINTDPFLQLQMLKNIPKDNPPAGSGNRRRELAVASGTECMYNTRGSQVSPSQNVSSTAKKDEYMLPSHPHRSGDALGHIQPNQPGSNEDPNMHTMTYKGRVVSVTNVHRKNCFGQTLLHKAAKEGNTQTVHQFLELGADVNMADNAGWTPLHEAALCGHYEIAEALFKHGANPDKTNDEGREIASRIAAQPFLHKIVEENMTQNKREDLPALTYPENVSMETHDDTQLDRQATESKGEPEPEDTGLDIFSTDAVMQENQINPMRANSPPALLLTPSPPRPFTSSGIPPPQKGQDIQLCSTPVYASVFRPSLEDNDCDSDQTVDYLGDSSDESVDWAVKATQNFNLAAGSMEAHVEDKHMHTFPTEMV